jgi:hypothetical protein
MAKKKITLKEVKLVGAKISVLGLGVYLALEPIYEFLRLMSNNMFKGFFAALSNMIQNDGRSMLFGALIVFLGLYAFELR